jgi:hypothetical protein
MTLREQSEHPVTALHGCSVRLLHFLHYTRTKKQEESSLEHFTSTSEYIQLPQKQIWTAEKKKKEKIIQILGNAQRLSSFYRNTHRRWHQA